MVKGSSLIGLAIGKWFLNRRWWWVTLASVTIFVFEFIEYQPLTQGFDEHFFFELLFYGVFLPMSTGLALTWLAASRAELAWSAYYQDLTHNLSTQLNNVHSHNELAAVFLQFIKVVMPLVGAALYKYDPLSHTYKSIQSWFANKDMKFSNSISECTAPDCPCLNNNLINEMMLLQPCRDPNIITSSKVSTSFCIPFLFSSLKVGGARFFIAPASTASQEGQRLLNETAPLIASTFHRIQLEGLMKDRNDSFSVEQIRIARDVHDTLGHSLAYLRLRLDQISMEFSHGGMGNMLQEVETLRDVAKEAYDQMRDVLTALSPDPAANLNDTFLNYADRINRRGTLKLMIHQDGQPRSLSAGVQRNIFYIFQETLTNIEKHAHAHLVDINLNWCPAVLEVDVADDGVGFDPASNIPDGHYGLNNIRERALESGLYFSIASQPGLGTRVTLMVPYQVVP